MFEYLILKQICCIFNKIIGSANSTDVYARVGGLLILLRYLSVYVIKQNIYAYCMNTCQNFTCLLKMTTNVLGENEKDNKK